MPSVYLRIVQAAQTDLRRQCEYGLIDPAAALAEVAQLQQRLDQGDDVALVNRDLRAMLLRWPATNLLIIGSQTRGYLPSELPSVAELAATLRLLKNSFIGDVMPTEGEVAHAYLEDAGIRNSTSAICTSTLR